MPNRLAKKQKYIWEPHPGAQTEALSRSEKEILFGGARGGGKSIDIDTKILTENGIYKRAGDITMQDKLVSANGKSTKLLGIYPQPEKQLYRITFDDGAWVDTDLEHRWSVWSNNHGWRDGWIIKTTEQLLNEKGRYAIPLMDFGYNASNYDC
jgi:hypothetical protein